MRRLLTLAVLMILACPSVASAARAEMVFKGRETNFLGGHEYVTVDLYDVHVTAAPGEANAMTLARSAPRGIRFADSGAALEAGDGCRADAGGVVCDPPAPLGAIGDVTIDLGDGDDSFTATDLSATVSGGPGDDSAVIHTDFAQSYDTAYLDWDGGPGADTLTGDGLGARPLAEYSGRTAGVAVSLDGVANDGEPGEGDNVGPSTFRVYGGSGADTMLAGSAPAWFESGAGDDKLIGGPGPDELHAGPGDDRLSGGAGDDDVIGDAGADISDGGPGNDRFDARDGSPDDIRGGDGEDSVDFIGAPVDVPDVVVTLDDRPGDGPAGEGDNVHADVEDVATGDGDDRVTGSAAANKIETGGGHDVVDGGPGDDKLYGGGASFEAVAAVKSLTGGPGHDTFTYVLPTDVVHGRDGEADRLECVAPVGIEDVDAIDTGQNCAGRTGLPFPTPHYPVKFDREGVGRVPIAAGDHVYGKLSLARGSVVLYSGTYDLGASKKERRLTIRLDKRAQRSLRRKRKLLVAATVIVPRGYPAETRTETYSWKLIAGR